MANSRQFYTYRLTNLPNQLQKSEIRKAFTEDAKLIKTISLAPCTHQPSTFNVATITFDGEPSVKKHLVNGEGRFPCRDVAGCDQINIDNTFYGLTPLNNGSSTVRADLIAITGLAGRAFGSWQNEDGGMWLRDYLPFDIPDLRVFIYGYPATLQRSPSRAGIYDFTQGFTNAILSLRSGPEVAQTPLILVGHSLGCIIIKQALIESLSFVTSIPRFHQSVCGMVFFGAPHRGLHNPQLQNILSSMPPEDLVRDLRPDSSLLISLNQRFPYVCKDMKIISCYETHETKTPQLIDSGDPDSKWESSGPTAYLVPKSSACLDWPEERELRIPVHADHSKIAKLENSHGSEYHQIKDQIRNLIDMAPGIMRRRQERYLANQNLLNLFLMFQYEYFWFKAWEMHILGRTPPHTPSSDTLQLNYPPQVFSSIPYGHPSYPIVTEIHIIIDALGQLLEKYRVLRQAKRPNEEEGSSVNDDLTQVPSWSMPREYGSHMGIHVTLQGSIESQSDHAYGLSNWSSSDRMAFGNTMTKFRQANRELSNLNPPTPSLDLIASSKLLSMLPTNPGGLRLVESVSQLDKLYSSLSKRASLMQKYQSNNPSEENEELLFPLSSIHISKGAGYSNFRYVSDLRPRENSMQNVSRAQWVLVEWRSYRTAKDRTMQQQARNQAFQLAHDLGISNKPPLLKTLSCVGFVQDREYQRFGFLFQLPINADVASSPLTLHAYLKGDKLNGKSIPLPTFGERIGLARSLAFSVIELHNAGILHKSLHSGNVLFFPARVTKAISVSESFIGGFEISRPDQDGELSIDMEGGSFDIYKHPELRDPSNELQGRPGFERKHDVYSLGLILLEIGVWQPLQSFFNRKLSPLESARKVLSVARTNLPHQMGRIFCEAVVECIDCEQFGLSRTGAKSMGADTGADGLSNDERGGVSLELFIEKVIKRLEECHCRD